MGNNGSLIREGTPVASIKAAAPAAGTVNGASIDMRGYDEVLVIVSVGAIASAHTLDVKLQESANNSAWADITDGAFPQCVDGDGENEVHLGRVVCSYSGRKRYLRAVGTGVGATAIPYSVILIPTRDQTADSAPTYGLSI